LYASTQARSTFPAGVFGIVVCPNSGADATVRVVQNTAARGLRCVIVQPLTEVDSSWTQKGRARRSALARNSVQFKQARQESNLQPPVARNPAIQGAQVPLCHRPALYQR